MSDEGWTTKRILVVATVVTIFVLAVIGAFVPDAREYIIELVKAVTPGAFSGAQ